MIRYRDAGVDIDAADAAKRSMRGSVDRGDPRVLNTSGAFASLVQGSFSGYEDPVLVLKTEEPGSKQLLAFRHGRVRSICADTINHLINDVIVMGAEPLYAQDAVICGRLDPTVVPEIVAGFADACREQGCVLVGGETSEQPGVLAPGTYVLTASLVGVVERSRILDGSAIRPGDQLLSLRSSGLHTNGYTLVRALLEADPALAERDTGGETFLEAILRPHRCYYRPLRDLFAHAGLHGLAHVTGGGIGDNLRRILPAEVDAAVDLTRLDPPAVFRVIRAAGDVPDDDLLRTFNLGTGIVAVVAPDAVTEVVDHLQQREVETTVIGEVREGSGEVTFEGQIGW